MGSSFEVEWQRRYDLVMRSCDHLINPWNENKPVRIARDGQEMPASIGKQLVDAIEQAAVADNVVKPRESRLLSLDALLTVDSAWQYEHTDCAPIWQSPAMVSCKELSHVNDEHAGMADHTFKPHIPLLSFPDCFRCAAFCGAVHVQASSEILK